MFGVEDYNFAASTQLPSPASCIVLLRTPIIQRSLAELACRATWPARAVPGLFGGAGNTICLL
jgi:hypothetical protein